MKRTVRGRAELVMSGLELVQKLAVLIPPPRIHLVRFRRGSAHARRLRARENRRSKILRRRATIAVATSRRERVGQRAPRKGALSFLSISISIGKRLEHARIKDALDSGMKQLDRLMLIYRVQ